MLASIEKDPTQQILSQIEKKRKEMITTSRLEGLTGYNTLKRSKELDKLILFYQRKNEQAVFKHR